jgi:hypothetical protein
MNAALSLLAVALLSGPPPQSIPRGDPHELWIHAAIAAAGIGQATDLSTTMYAMGRSSGQFSEANPLLAWAEDRPVAMGLVKGLVAAGTTYGLIRLHHTRPKTALAASLGLVALQSWVTYRNMQTIRGR